MKKKGSAIITIIAAIVVLTILALGFISSKTQKTTISKHLSDEKKVEAIAESVSDLLLAAFKNKSNTFEANNKLYFLLRAPLKYKDVSAGILDVSNVNAIDDGDLLNYVTYKDILAPTIEEFGWTNKVEIKTKCELVSAEAFTPYDPAYKVTTIDSEHLKAKDNSTAHFLDASNEGEITPTSDGDEKKWNTDGDGNDWDFYLKFPSSDPLKEVINVEVEVDISIFSGKVDVGINIERNEEKSLDLSIDFDIPEPLKSFIQPFLNPFTPISLDVRKIMNDSNILPKVTPKNMKGVKNRVLNNQSMRYELGSYIDEINSDFGDKTSPLTSISNNNLDANFDDPLILEKGGVLRLTTEVEYSKSETNKLKKVLIAEIPFKASDVQPIAPEYTFFVANSDLLLTNPDDIVNINPNDELDLNQPDGNDVSGYFVLHNLPHVDGEVSTDFSDGRIPGMVRVNSKWDSSKRLIKIKSNLGECSAGDPTQGDKFTMTSELNRFLTPFDSSKLDEYGGSKFNTILSFKSKSIQAQRFHEVELPIILDEDYIPPFIGLKNLFNIFKQSAMTSSYKATLLFGDASMEYPLGIRAEGPIQTLYSRIMLDADPKLKITGIPDSIAAINDFDKTEVTVNHEWVSTYSDNNQPYAFNHTGQDETQNDPITFGMQGFESYNKNEGWANDRKYMPANCYDALQYAKKATRYYDEGSEFLADCGKEKEKGGLNNNGTIELCGVYFIKNDLVITEPLNFKGNGLIVANKNIKISSNIECDKDGNSSLGLIARTGAIVFSGEVTVDAACFSCNYPSADGKTTINGNLTCNVFNRGEFIDLDVYYDNRITSVTPLASLRKVGKFEPKRYCVAFDDNWSKFVYEKKKD